MDKQKLREQRVLSQLNLEKLPFKVDTKNFKNFGQAISLLFRMHHNNQVKSEQLRWCFSTVKRFKIFLEIFNANEEGREVYKEEIAKKISEYSYKTISKIIDDGNKKGIYVLLQPDGKAGTDSKIKNIRPSEELIVDFLNWNIDIFDSIGKIIASNKH